MTITPEENINVEVGELPHFNYCKRLHDQLHNLEELSTLISSDLCTILSKTTLSSLTTEDFKSTKLQKKKLGEYILKLLKTCHEISTESNLQMMLHQTPPEAITRPVLAEISQKVEETLAKTLQAEMTQFDNAQDQRFKEIQNQIAQLQSYSDSLHHGPEHRTKQQHAQSAMPAEYNTPSSACLDEINKLPPVDDYQDDFIPTGLADKLQDMLNNCEQLKINVESGHSVMTYGHTYHYVGSKNPVDSPIENLPGPILEVIELIGKKFGTSLSEGINSCLVNRYCGPDAFLPRHADDEFSINPKSSIFTVSLGSKTTVKFTNQHNGLTEDRSIEPNSVYVMSRASQQLWKHQISKGDISSSTVRYSLTFRHLSEEFLRSTVVIGDSNTKHLHFGTGKGTFGQLIPGERVEALHIDNLNPLDCCGYKNIFIHCGINSIKHVRVNTAEKVEEHFSVLKHKLEQIMTLCPDSNIVVAPILPTKRDEWNVRGIHFNRCLFRFENLCRRRFSTLHYSVFKDCATGRLRNDLGSYWNPDDALHLGSGGIRLLVGMIRERVFNSKIVSNKTYASVVSGHSASAPGTDRVAAPPLPSSVAAT